MIVLSKETVEAYESRMVAAAVPEVERPFYLKWVRFYLDFCQKYEHPPREAQSIIPFLAKLTSKGQSERGLQQAGEAVHLLLRRGKERPRGDSLAAKDSGLARESPAANVGRKLDVGLPEVLTPAGEKGASWEKEYRELEGAIKLRNYSPKTHEVYRMWLERFQTFTRSKPPGALDGEDAKGFLTDLAVRHNVAGSTQPSGAR